MGRTQVNCHHIYDGVGYLAGTSSGATHFLNVRIKRPDPAVSWAWFFLLFVNFVPFILVDGAQVFQEVARGATRCISQMPRAQVTSYSLLHRIQLETCPNRGALGFFYGHSFEEVSMNSRKPFLNPRLGASMLQCLSCTCKPQQFKVDDNK